MRPCGRGRRGLAWLGRVARKKVYVPLWRSPPCQLLSASTESTLHSVPRSSESDAHTHLRLQIRENWKGRTTPIATTTTGSFSELGWPDNTPQLYQQLGRRGHPRPPHPPDDPEQHRHRLSDHPQRLQHQDPPPSQLPTIPHPP